MIQFLLSTSADPNDRFEIFEYSSTMELTARECYLAQVTTSDLSMATTCFEVITLFLEHGADLNAISQNLNIHTFPD